jgi:hypothetical protein
MHFMSWRLCALDYPYDYIFIPDFPVMTTCMYIHSSWQRMSLALNSFSYRILFNMANIVSNEWQNSTCGCCNDPAICCKVHNFYVTIGKVSQVRATESDINTKNLDLDTWCIMFKQSKLSLKFLQAFKVSFCRLQNPFKFSTSKILHYGYCTPLLNLWRPIHVCTKQLCNFWYPLTNLRVP